MALTSVISHPPKIPMLMLRMDYVGICKSAPDANCAAGILAVFEYWTNVKAGGQPQAQARNIIDISGGKEPTQDDSLWVYKKQDELQDELFGLFGKNKINDNLLWLRNETEFLLTRQNPAHKWDRTLQYQFNIESVQNAINLWYSRDFKNKDSNDLKQSVDKSESKNREPDNKQAIPETTTETTTEKKDIALAAQAVTDVKIGVAVKKQFVDVVVTPIKKPKAEKLSSADYESFMELLGAKFNLHGGRVRDVYHQLRGSTKNQKSKRYEYGELFRDKPVTLIELQGFIAWYPKQCVDCPFPVAAETLEDWFGKYRAQLTKQHATQMARHSHRKDPINLDMLESA